MLHILWIVLKIILIILAIAIGLVLMAILLILFCPVRYKGEGRKTEEAWKKATAAATISWLFHALSFHISYTDGELQYGVRLFGCSMDNLFHKISAGRRRRPEKTKENEENEGLPSQDFEKTTKISENMHGQINSQIKENKEAILEEDSAEHTAEHTAEDLADAPEKEAIEVSVPAEKRSFFHSFLKKIQDLLQIPKKIIGKIQNIALTIRNFCGKIGWWKDFLNHPKTRAAISCIWTHGKYLIRHIFPTKIEGQITFGNEDPSVTGMILAGIGTTIPLHKNKIRVTPVFDGENIMEGNIKFRGRIYGFVFIRAAIEIYLNNNVKYVIRRWRHKEG